MDYDDDNFLDSPDYEDDLLDTSLITVKEEEEEYVTPFTNNFTQPHQKRNHFVQHTSMPQGLATAVRPEYTKIDKIAFHNHLSLLCLMHGQATGVVTEPIVFDAEEQKLRETRRIKFSF